MKSILLISLFVLFGSACQTPTSSIDYVNTPVTKPTPFAPGIISTEDHSEFSIAFSPDGLTAYFSRRAPEEKQKIYSTQFKDGSWTQPELMPFSTDRDESPFVTADGEWFFFGSERPIPGKPNKGNFDMNIWAMKQTSEGWSEPKPLDDRINQVQAEGEEWPLGNSSQLFSHDNKTFYFTAMMRGRAGIELYQTEFDGVNFSDPVRIEGIFADPKYWVHAATVSPDGQYLVFNSYGAPGGLGGEDIYVSKKTETGWSEAVAISNKINSKDEESGPAFSRDGKYFFFTRAENLGNYEYGEWSIYFIETEALNLPSLFK